MSRVFLLAVLAVLAGGPAHTASVTYSSGNDLYRQCNDSKGSFNSGVCSGYIAAVSDFMKTHKINKSRACQPKDVPVEQAVAVVKKFLRDNPKDLHNSAHSIVGVALSDAFPCPKK